MDTQKNSYQTCWHLIGEGFHFMLKQAFGTNRCMIFAAIGLGISLVWCTLAGHAVGFSSSLESLGLPTNSRTFFLLGILLIGVVFVLIPKALREYDAALRYILPLLSSFGTACFALSAKQNLFPPVALAVIGLIVFGFGYFWIVAHFNLLLARTQSFKAVVWCVVVGLLLSTFALPLFDRFVSPAWQVVAAIVLPLFAAGTFEIARRAAVRQPVDEAEEELATSDDDREGKLVSKQERTAFGARILPRRLQLSAETFEVRNLLILLVSVSLLLATVRSLGSMGLWGEGHSGLTNPVSWILEWAVSGILLTVFAYFALVKTSHWDVKVRFQPAFLIAILGLLIVAMQSDPTGWFAVVISDLMRLDDSFAHLLFWLVVAVSLDAVDIPSYRVIGIAAVSYALSSILWVLFLSTVNAVSSVLVLVVIYAFTVIAMHAGWASPASVDTAGTVSVEGECLGSDGLGNTPAFNESLRSVDGDHLSGTQVTRIIADRCVRLAARCKLSPRETEIFILLAQGRTRIYIQEELVLAENTVKTHVSHIYAKLNVSDRQQMMDVVLGVADKSD
ncbi:MAG: helix-turn-helix transcriptional regulator [Raoultibacter sp.]